MQCTIFLAPLIYLIIHNSSNFFEFLYIALIIYISLISNALIKALKEFIFIGIHFWLIIMQPYGYIWFTNISLDQLSLMIQSTGGLPQFFIRDFKFWKTATFDIEVSFFFKVRFD